MIAAMLNSNAFCNRLMDILGLRKEDRIKKIEFICQYGEVVTVRVTRNISEELGEEMLDLVQEYELVERQNATSET